jgi:hypothetical protein
MLVKSRCWFCVPLRGARQAGVFIRNEGYYTTRYASCQATVKNEEKGWFVAYR